MVVLELVVDFKPGKEIKTKNDMPYVETNLEEIKNTITQSIEIIPQLKKSSIKSFWGGLIDLTPDALQ